MEAGNLQEVEPHFIRGSGFLGAVLGDLPPNWLPVSSLLLLHGLIPQAPAGKLSASHPPGRDGLCLLKPEPESALPALNCFCRVFCYSDEQND